MENNPQVSQFPALDDGHTVIEYRTNEPSNTSLLAYVDTLVDGTYSLTLADPYYGTQRTIKRKTAKGAQSALIRHLADKGYTL